MDDLERLKVLLYQYILFRADFYKSAAEEAFNNIRCSKKVTTSDIERFYISSLKSEIFEDFYKDLSDILGSFH